MVLFSGDGKDPGEHCEREWLALDVAHVKKCEGDTHLARDQPATGWFPGGSRTLGEVASKGFKAIRAGCGARRIAPHRLPDLGSAGCANRPFRSMRLQASRIPFQSAKRQQGSISTTSRCSLHARPYGIQSKRNRTGRRSQGPRSSASSLGIGLTIA